MGQLLDLAEARRRLGLALEILCHDRWVLGFLRGGSMQPIAASEVSRRLLQCRPLLPLSRRALFEQRPVVVNSVFPYTNPSSTFDWELDWPAIIYAPIGEARQRPIGLLILGCRRDYWYSDDDVEYAGTLSAALAPLVAALRGPLGRMNDAEMEVVQLMSCGMSAPEIARALKTDEARAQTLVHAVTKKLNQRTPNRIPVCVW
jgi:DNA-binding CsgD family transcriptional regulator